MHGRLYFKIVNTGATYVYNLSAIQTQPVPQKDEFGVQIENAIVWWFVEVKDYQLSLYRPSGYGRWQLQYYNMESPAMCLDADVADEPSNAIVMP